MTKGVLECSLLSAQLPAGSGDISSFAITNHGRVVVVDQNFLKREDC